jgi:hypothetical protein
MLKDDQELLPVAKRRVVNAHALRKLELGPHFRDKIIGLTTFIFLMIFFIHRNPRLPGPFKELPRVCKQQVVRTADRGPAPAIIALGSRPNGSCPGRVSLRKSSIDEPVEPFPMRQATTCAAARACSVASFLAHPAVCAVTMSFGWFTSAVRTGVTWVSDSNTSRAAPAGFRNRAQRAKPPHRSSPRARH